VPNHLWLDFDLVEFLAGVDTDDAADHLGYNNHITEMRLDEVRLLVGLGLLLGLSQLLDESHGLTLETAVEPTASTGMDEVTEFFGGEVQEPAYISVPSPVRRPTRRERDVATGRARTGRGRLHGKRTCGTLSSS
jgi:hypothetical protein